MNKLAKTIIGVLVGVIVILLIVIILLASSKNKCKDDISDNTNTNDEIKQLVGVYSYTSQQNKSYTITLNEDMTCIYDKRNECKWGLSEDKREIIINQATYKIAFDKCSFRDEEGGLSSIGDNSATKEECENKLQKYKEQYIMVNPRCEYDNTSFTTLKATIINSGFILNTLTYYKVK